MSNTTTNATITAIADDLVLLPAAICVGGICFLFAAFFAYNLLRKSQFALCWRKKCHSHSATLRLWEHSLNCVACFPKAKSNRGATTGSSSSCYCCCMDPQDFHKRHLCQRIWMFFVTLLILVLPFLLLVIGGICAVFFVQPQNIGYGLMFVSLAVFLLGYATASYSWNGYSLTMFSRICLVTASSLLCAYAFLSALLIKPLTFTGVSAVAMAFQMCLTIPAMYTLADGRGISVSFQEWSNAVKKYDAKKLDKKRKKEKNPIDQLFTLVNQRKRDGKHTSTTDTFHNDSWKDQSVSSILSLEEIIRQTPNLAKKRTNYSIALVLFVLSAIVLVVYSVAIFIRANDWWEKPLGFITMAACLVYDGSLLLVSKHYSVKDTAKTVMIMTVYRVVLVIGGMSYWFLGHTLCFLCVGCLFCQLIANRFVPQKFEDHHQKKEVKDMLDTIERAFRDQGDASSAKSSDSVEAKVSTNSSTNGRMLLMFVFVTIAYVGEIIAAAVSNLPKWSGAEQYQLGVYALLFVLFILMASIAYRQYFNMLHLFLEHVVELANKEQNTESQEVSIESMGNSEQNSSDQQSSGETKDVSSEQIMLRSETEEQETERIRREEEEELKAMMNEEPEELPPNGMTSMQACRFWCVPKENNGSMLFWIFSMFSWGMLIGLGVYIQATTNTCGATAVTAACRGYSTPLVLAVGLPLYLLFAAIAYTRWHKINDFEIDLIVIAFGLAALVALGIISLVIFLSESTQPDLGFTLGAIILILTTTFLSLKNWFNTFERSRTLIFTSLLSGVVLILWALLYWLLVLNGAIDMQSLALLFVFLGYPTLVLLALSLIMFKDEEYKITKNVISLFGVSMLLIILFFGAVCIVDLTAGMVLLSLGMVLLSILFTIGIWITNNYVANKAMKIIFIVTMCILAGLGVGGGLYQSSFIVGFSLFWGSLVLLSVGCLVCTTFGSKKEHWTEPHYNTALCYPTYSLDQQKLKLIHFDSPSQAAATTLGLCIVWGVVASALWTNHEWAGLGVLAISMAWGTAWNFHSRFTTIARFRNIQDHITFRMLEEKENESMSVALKHITTLHDSNSNGDDGGNKIQEDKKEEKKETESSEEKKSSKENKQDEVTIESICQELQAVEEVAYNRWKNGTFGTFSKRTSTDIESGGSMDAAESMEQMLANMHRLHRKLAERRALDLRQSVAYQVMTIYIAQGRKNQRERLLREVVEDLQDQIDFNNLSTPKQQQELCRNIRTFIQERKQTELVDHQRALNTLEKERKRKEEREKLEQDEQQRRTKKERKETTERERKRMERDRQKREERKEREREERNTKEEEERRVREEQEEVERRQQEEKRKQELNDVEAQKKYEAEVAERIKKRKEEIAERKRQKKLDQDEKRRRKKEMEENKRKQMEEDRQKRELAADSLRWGTLSWAEEHFEKAKKSDVLYKDKVWPVGRTRTGEKIQKSGSTRVKYKNGFKQDGYFWKRAPDIAAHMKRGSKAVLVSGGFDVVDVNQGESDINTSFLLASMASLAERRPELLQRCFLKQDIDKGVYMMKFYGCSYHGQEECVVLMDDVVAMKNSSPLELNFGFCPGYGKGKKKKRNFQMWSVLMEEAYCKISGGSFKENDGGSSKFEVV